MYILKTISVFLLLACLVSCSGRKGVADPADYNSFLNPKNWRNEANRMENEFLFWGNRLSKDTGNIVDMLKLASLHGGYFEKRGGIQDLHTADSLLRQSGSKLGNGDPDIYFALTKNAMTRHGFIEAEAFLDSAMKRNPDPYRASLMNFESSLEKGRLSLAAHSLQSISDYTDFNFLVRKSRFEDIRGNLDEAIALMEQALDRVRHSGKPLFCWTLSNLGDLYGHAGKIEKSYRAYMEVLKKDSTHAHSLKGIARIAFSHDRNPVEARRILAFLYGRVQSPDLLLDLADVEEWKGNRKATDEYRQKFIQEVTNSAYGGMYNKYLILLYAERKEWQGEALRLAQEEIINRPTPETYEWLAWAYHCAGKADKASEILNSYVYKRNFEPASLWRMARIYHASGDSEKAKSLLVQCRESRFELGPLQSRNVEELCRKTGLIWKN